MKYKSLDQLEKTLHTLGSKGDLSSNQKQAIRDKVFQSIGQLELADAIVQGEQKATVAVSLQHLKKALIPQKLSFSIPTTLAVMVMVFVTSIITGAMAQNSSPTDTLFPIKKVLERIELAFVSNPISKAEISLNIADERLKYLENSSTEEPSLHKVLTESQIAFVEAKAALTKVQEAQTEEEDEGGVSNLIERFGKLVDTQKNILNNLEEESASDEIKQTIIAVRNAIEPTKNSWAIINTNNNDNASYKNDSTVASTDSVASWGSDQPANSGAVVLQGEMGSYAAKPVIIVKGNRYFLVGSSVNLIPYMGMKGAMVFGRLEGDTIILSKILINGKVIWESNAGGDAYSSITDKLLNSVNQ